MAPGHERVHLHIHNQAASRSASVSKARMRSRPLVYGGRAAACVRRFGGVAGVGARLTGAEGESSGAEQHALRGLSVNVGEPSTDAVLPCLGTHASLPLMAE